MATTNTQSAGPSGVHPDINKSTKDLFLVSFEFLQQTSLLLQQGNEDPPNLENTFYTFENCFEKLEDIQPYLPSVMSCLTSFLSINTEKSISKELAAGAIGTVAVVVKELFKPYSPSVVDQLKLFISENQRGSTRGLKIKSMDTLCAIAKKVGLEVFQPVAYDLLKYGLYLIEENDPWIHISCCNLLATVTTVLKSEIVPYLPYVVESMLQTLKSTKQIRMSTLCCGITDFNLFKGDYEIENEGMDKDKKDVPYEEDDENDLSWYGVEFLRVTAKVSACLALKEICYTVGSPFIPFIEASFNEIRKLLESQEERERNVSISLLRQFCLTINHHLKTGKLEFQKALEEYINVLLPKLCYLAREDTEDIAIVCLYTIKEIVIELKQNAVYGGNLESVCLLIKDVFNNKLACQNNGDALEEADVLAITGELLESLVKVVPWQQFSPYLAELLPLLFARTKETCSFGEKNVIIRTLDNIIISLVQLGTVQLFISHLQPIFLAGIKDENEGVRRLSVCGLGVLLENGGDLNYDQYPSFLQALLNILETAELKDQMEKYNIHASVYRIIKRIFQKEKNLPRILKVVFKAFAGQKHNDECVAFVCSLLQQVYSEFSIDFENIESQLSENTEVLSKVILV